MDQTSKLDGLTDEEIDGQTEGYINEHGDSIIPSPKVMYSL